MKFKTVDRNEAESIVRGVLVDNGLKVRPNGKRHRGLYVRSVSADKFVLSRKDSITNRSKLRGIYKKKLTIK